MEHNTLKVGAFVPCCVDQFCTSTAQKMVNIIEKSGHLCYYPKALTCCGYNLFSQGDLQGAKELGIKMIEAFQECGCIVTCSSGCAAYVRKWFRSLFAHSARYNEALQFADKCFDISDFLVNVLQQPALPVAFPHRVALLDHSRSLRDYPLRDAPRQLLRTIDGITLHELGELDTNLLFASQFASEAKAMMMAVMRSAAEQGVQYIVTTEPSLALQLNGFAATQGFDIKCCHILDILVG